MSWFALAENPEALTRLYTEPPALADVALHELALSRDGPLLRLTCALPRYPDRPPARWKRAGYDAALLHLQLLDVQEFSLTGWSHDLRVSVRVAKADRGRVALSLEGAGCRLTATGFLRVDGVSPYLRA